MKKVITGWVDSDGEEITVTTFRNNPDAFSIIVTDEDGIKNRVDLLFDDANRLLECIEFIRKSLEEPDV